MERRVLAVGAGLAVLVGGWALFRPEKLFIDKKVNEGLPIAAAQTASRDETPIEISKGSFHSVAHKSAGVASIYRLPDGKKLLRFTQFETSNGPALHVYLVAAADAKNSGSVKRAGFIDLGPLKGNVGDQNYPVPDNADLERYRAVTIWCQRFSVNFATAPLSGSSTTASSGGQDAMSAPIAQATGRFHSVAHKSAGVATIYRLPDDRQILRLTQFETSNGPAVHVYLVAAADAKDNGSVKRAGFIDLGSLKGNVGDQNYDLPAGVDLNKYRAVTIWCQRFSVNFATAPLAPEQA